MSRYNDLVTLDQTIDLSLDTSNLESRLDEMQTKIDEVEGMDEDAIDNLIDQKISDASLVAQDDVDDYIRDYVNNNDLVDRDEVRDMIAETESNSEAFEELTERVKKLETLMELVAETESRNEALEARVEQLGSANDQATRFFDLLRQAIETLLRR